jgi:hypothetical protein
VRRGRLPKSRTRDLGRGQPERIVCLVATPGTHLRRGRLPKDRTLRLGTCSSRRIVRGGNTLGTLRGDGSRDIERADGGGDTTQARLQSSRSYPGSYRGRRIWRSDGISGDGFRHLLPSSHLLGLGRVGGRIVPFTVGTQRNMRVRPLVETPTETNRTSPWVPTWDCTGTNGGTHQGSHSEDEMKGMRGWRRWLNPLTPARGYEYREGRKRPWRERSTHTGARSARVKLWSPHQRHERRSVRW